MSLSDDLLHLIHARTDERDETAAAAAINWSEADAAADAAADAGSLLSFLTTKQFIHLFIYWACETSIHFIV